MRKTLQVGKNTIIYIFAPGNIASGGPEALHQLHYYLKKCGFTAYLCYYGEQKVHPKYQIYSPGLIDRAEIRDEHQHIVITPEINTRVLNHYKNVQKCIWWLGLQYYDGYETFPVGSRAIFKQLIRTTLPSQVFSIRQHILKVIAPQRAMQAPFIPTAATIHLCGSKFAFDYVCKTFLHVHLFVEPLSLPFTKLDKPDLSADHRGDAIVYNPAKPSLIMSKLLKRADLSFVPLAGLDYEGVRDLFRRSKLYIDFGFFGGPERVPKEAVCNGTMLLVGKRNAAVNDFDIAIPAEFKLTDVNNEAQVVAKIKDMLANYETHIRKIEPFRTKIFRLEADFIKAIGSIFVRHDQ